MRLRIHPQAISFSRHYLSRFFLVTCLVQTATAQNAGGLVKPPEVEAIAKAVASQEAEVLLPGQNVEKALAGEETHRYQIRLAAGEVLQFSVEQKGIDVVLLVTAPGKEPLTIDFSQSQTSREDAVLFAEQAGTGQIEVKSAAPKAPAGKYLLTSDALRLATEHDRAAARAQQFFAQGIVLEAQNKAENIPIVIKTFEEAAQLYRAANQPRGETRALKAAGGASFRSGNFQKAFEFFNQALPRARASGDLKDLAGVLNDLGLTSARLGDLAKAIECFQESMPLQQATGDRIGEAISLNNLGGILIGRGEIEKGLGMLERSLALRRELGDEIGEARMLQNLAGAYARLGQTQRAMEMGVRVLSLRRKLKDKRGEAATLSLLADLYASLGETRQAMEYYQLALKFHREMGDKAGEATVLHNTGNALISTDESQQGLDYLLQALSRRQEIGDKSGQADTLDTIGYFYKRVGDKSRALEYMTQALQLRQTIDDKAREAASWTHIGLHYHDAGEYQKALEHFQKSLALTQAVRYQVGVANSHGNIGLALEKLGKKQEALEHYSRSLAISQEIEARDTQAAALINLGNLNGILGNHDKAMEHLHQALAISRASSLKDREITALIHLAQTHRGLGRLTEAQSHAQAAIALIETSRQSFMNPEFRAGYFGTLKQAYEIHLDVLMQLHQREPAAKHAESAFQTAERAKARTLLESLTEAHANLRQGIEPALLERERALQQRLDRKAVEQSRLLSGKHTEAQAARLAQELSTLTTEYEQLQADIRKRSPHYAALTQPQPLSLSEIQQTVVADPDTLLLEYALGEERGYLWAVTNDAITSHELPKREAIERSAERLYALMTARNQRPKFESAAERQARVTKADAEFQLAAAELSRIVLGPVANQLGKKRLLVVADGKLQYVPFAALPVPAPERAKNPQSYKPLIAEHEVVHLPSASTLAVLRRELKDRQPAPKTVAALADPVFDAADERVKSSLANAQAAKDVAGMRGEIDELTRAIGDLGAEDVRGALARLPYTRREADAIVKLAPAGSSKLALDFDASQSAAASEELGQYRYVHFATHGILNNQHPALSGIVLSLVDRNGKQQDGFLRMIEVFNLKLPAEMVVLSGCKTGLGKDIKGEGLIGLTRGFMYAGAARVMVSLWDVSDRATSVLMGKIYEGLLRKGMSPAAALRQAQLSVRQDRRWQSPYYWAGFVLHGEPR